MGHDPKSNGSGRGRAGRFQGRANDNGRDGRSTKSTKTGAQVEMKFGFQGQGGPRCRTFQPVKESILSFIQKTKKGSKDVRVSLDEEEIVDLTAGKPKLSFSKDADKVANANEQKAFDKEFEGELKDWRLRRKDHQKGLEIVYALIKENYCTKTM
jgi:hypothetical protein